MNKARYSGDSKTDFFELLQIKETETKRSSMRSSEIKCYNSFCKTSVLSSEDSSVGLILIKKRWKAK